MFCFQRSKYAQRQLLIGAYDAQPHFSARGGEGDVIIVPRAVYWREPAAAEGDDDERDVIIARWLVIMAAGRVKDGAEKRSGRMWVRVPSCPPLDGSALSEVGTYCTRWGSGSIMPPRSDLLALMSDENGCLDTMPALRMRAGVRGGGGGAYHMRSYKGKAVSIDKRSEIISDTTRGQWEVDRFCSIQNHASKPKAPDAHLVRSRSESPGRPPPPVEG